MPVIAKSSSHGSQGLSSIFFRLLLTGGNDERMAYHLLQRPASTGAAAVQLATVDNRSPLASSEYLCPPFYEETTTTTTNTGGGETGLTHLLEFQPATARSSVSRHRGVMMRKQHSVSCASQCCNQKL